MAKLTQEWATLSNKSSQSDQSSLIIVPVAMLSDSE